MTRLIFYFCLLFITAEADSQDPQALSIIKKINETVGSNTQLQYDYYYEGWGKTVGKFRGKVYMDKRNGMKLLVELNTLDEDDNIVLQESIFTDGNNIKLLDKTNKILKIGSAGGGSPYLMSYAWYAIFREFLMPAPFAMQMQNKSMTYDGEIVIDGVDCHIVGMDNPWGDRNFWYLGKDDHQIHGQKTINNTPGTEGGFNFTMQNLKVNQEINESVFNLSGEGVQVINEDERMISVGQPAPEWVLINASGERVSSKQLKGKMVMLDFWASWCSPCWQIMPIVEKIRTDYFSKNLIVFGVNVWENPELDIDAYLKKKQLNNYDNLLDEDASVAKRFKIASLPLVVLIGKDGTILYINNGMDQNMDKNIRDILDK